MRKVPVHLAPDATKFLVRPCLTEKSRCGRQLPCESRSLLHYCITLCQLSRHPLLARHCYTLVCNQPCTAVNLARLSKPCSSSVLTLSSMMSSIPYSPCSRLSQTPQLLIDQPWRYRDFRSGSLRYHAVRAPRDMYHMHGTGGVHGVATFDRGVAGHAFHSPEREGKRGLDIATRRKVGYERTVSMRLRSGDPAYFAPVHHGGIKNS